MSTWDAKSIKQYSIPTDNLNFFDGLVSSIIEEGANVSQNIANKKHHLILLKKLFLVLFHKKMKIQDDGNEY